MTSVIPIEPIEPVIKKRKTRPSRKGKKAWRKNVDITEIEKTLEGIRDEERITGFVKKKKIYYFYIIN